MSGPKHVTFFIGFEDDEGRHRIGVEKFKITEKRVTKLRGGSTLGGLGYRTNYSRLEFRSLIRANKISRTKMEATKAYLLKLCDQVESLREDVWSAEQEWKKAQSDLEYNFPL